MELGDELARLRRKLDTLWAKDVTKRYNFDYGYFISNFCNTFATFRFLTFPYHSLPLPTPSYLPLCFPFLSFCSLSFPFPTFPICSISFSSFPYPFLPSPFLPSSRPLSEPFLPLHLPSPIFICYMYPSLGFPFHINPLLPSSIPTLSFLPTFSFPLYNSYYLVR